MLRNYVTLLKVNWGIILEYRASLVIWILTNTLPLVMLAVWLSLAEEGPVGAYGPGEFISYYLGILIVRQMTTVWVIWDLDREIRLGELSPKLLRPINPIHNHIALNLADKAFRLMTVIPLILVVIVLAPGVSYNLTPVTIPLFLLALSGAWGLRFLSQYCFGLLGFWITQALALNELWFAGQLMLGGVIAPLDLFPPAIVRLTQVLPFRYMLSLPVEIILGQLALPDILLGLGIQGLWLVLWLGIYKVLWREGLKRYGAVGA